VDRQESLAFLANCILGKNVSTPELCTDKSVAAKSGYFFRMGAVMYQHRQVGFRNVIGLSRAELGGEAIFYFWTAWFGTKDSCDVEKGLNSVSQ
jgi:hypothetical protein